MFLSLNSQNVTQTNLKVPLIAFNGVYWKNAVIASYLNVRTKTVLGGRICLSSSTGESDVLGSMQICVWLNKMRTLLLKTGFSSHF